MTDATTTTTEKFGEWALVEIMGHRKFAGYVTEQTLGGASFVRVDVPEVTRDVRQYVPLLGHQKTSAQTIPGYSKLFGAGSIYCISPVTEQVARQLATEICQLPLQEFDVGRVVSRPALPAPSDENTVDDGAITGLDDEDEDDDDW